MRVLVFGDSITQGYWDEAGGWVDRLRHYFVNLQLKDLQNPGLPTIFNLGVSADNTEAILGRIAPETIARTRRTNLPIVILQIGINDSSLQGSKAQVDAGLYRRNLETIIEKTRPLCTKLIFIGLSGCDEAKTNPVSWGDFYYNNVAIKDYETIMADVSKENDIPFIPVFDRFMVGLHANDDLLADGLHPNAAGHELIFDIVNDRLKELLS